jgi:hypothetical protein
LGKKGEREILSIEISPIYSLGTRYIFNQNMSKVADKSRRVGQPWMFAGYHPIMQGVHKIIDWGLDDGFAFAMIPFSLAAGSFILP